MTKSEPLPFSLCFPSVVTNSLLMRMYMAQHHHHCLPSESSNAHKEKMRDKRTRCFQDFIFYFL